MLKAHDSTNLLLSFMSAQALYMRGSNKATCFQVVSLTNVHKVQRGHMYQETAFLSSTAPSECVRSQTYINAVHTHAHVMCMRVGSSPRSTHEVGDPALRIC